MAADVAQFRPNLKAPSILNAWRDGRERERRRHAAQAEQQAAMAAMRSQAGQRSTWPLRRPATNDAVLEAAFPTVDGQRSFGAAETDRLTAGWTAVNTGINADLERALPTLRARSRDWFVNTDQGRRYGTLVQDNVVGSRAPRLQVRATLRDGSDQLDEIANTAIEYHWAQWCEHADISGRLDFDQLCRTNALCAARDGEFLTRRIRDRSLPYGYALQMLDTDRIYNGNGALGAQQGTDNVVRLGIEIDKLGRFQAAHLYNAHPGDGAMGLVPAPQAQRVPADQVFHGFVLVRPEQVRGYPWSAAVLRRANTLANFEGYALEAAKIGAGKMGFYITDKDAPGGNPLTFEDYRDATGALMQEVEAGMLEALPPGVSFQAFDPDYPHAFFAPFVTKFDRNIAAGLNVAHHNLSGDMTGVNYSSARIAEMAERDNWRSLQRWFIQSFVKPVFEEWLRIALLMGAITLPSGKALPAERFEKFRSAATFQPRGWRWVDPAAEMQAAASALVNNLASERQLSDEHGIDLDDTLLERQRYMQRVQALGLPLPPSLTPVPTGGAGASAAKPAASPAPAPASETTA